MERHNLIHWFSQKRNCQLDTGFDCFSIKWSLNWSISFGLYLCYFGSKCILTRSSLDVLQKKNTLRCSKLGIGRNKDSGECHCEEMRNMQYTQCNDDA
jgi:hypothetical protein